MKIVKKIMIVVLSLLIFVGTFFLENGVFRPVAQALRGSISVVVAPKETLVIRRGGQEQKLQGPEVFELLTDDIVDTKQSLSTQINFARTGIVRLNSSTVFSLKLADYDRQNFIFQLLEGRLWINNVLAPGVLNIIAGGGYLIPQHALADVAYDGNKTMVYAYRHNVLVGLVNGQNTFDQVVSTPTNKFINSYLMPQGTQTTIFLDKIKDNTDTLRKLLNSKLVKEFQSGVFDFTQTKSDLWVSQNLRLDSDVLQQVSSLHLKNIRDRGLKIGDVNSFGYSWIQSVRRFNRFLTLADDKMVLRLVDELLEHLFDSEYFIVFGRSTEAKDRLDYFAQLIQEHLSNQSNSFQEVFQTKLAQIYESLAFVSPVEPLFQIKTVVASMLIQNLGHSDEAVRHKFLLVRDLMNDVYDLIETNPQAARFALEQYYQQFNALITQEKAYLSKIKDILVSENQIMDNLLLQYPQFYRDSYFSMKNNLEKQWLAVVADDDKNEEKQSIVATKIDFLNRLKVFFLDDKVGVEDARQIVFRIFREIEDLQLSANAQVAVQDLFTKRLEDFGLFYSYLKSPEYVGTNLHGSSHREQYDEFLKAQQEQMSLSEVRNEILNGETNVDVETDVVQPTEADIVQPQDILIEQPAIDVLLEAQKDILIEQPQPDVSTEQPPLVLTEEEPIEEPLIEPSTEQIAQSNSSKVERVAKILLLQKLKTSGIDAKEEQINFIDIAGRSFLIQGATLTEDSTRQFSFKVDGADSLITDLKIVLPKGEKSIEGIFVIPDLAERVQKEFGND